MSRYFTEILDSSPKKRFFETIHNNAGAACFKDKSQLCGEGFRVMTLSIRAMCTFVLLSGMVTFGSVAAYAQSAQERAAGNVTAVPLAQQLQKAPVEVSAPVAAIAVPVAATTPVTTTSVTTTTTETTQQLPVSADAPPTDVVDPLAEFRRANAAPVKADPNQAPLPTPGGFQQPATAGALPDVNYNLEQPEVDIAAKEAELMQKAKDQAFDSALTGMMPLSPEQIRALLDKYKETREVSEARIGGAPKPEVVVETVSLEPGATPPTIKLSPGHVTSVTMMDLTGEPWPVQDVSWGGNFEVISPGDGGHIIRISPMGAMEQGNMSVQLVGLKTPVTFTLETQLQVVQYRFDARIPEYGPHAAPPLIEPGLTIAAGSDKTIGQILDGVPPAGTNKVRLSGVDARTSVYRVGDSTYLRTPLSLLSPGWSASAKSADGTTVYVVNNTPVFLLSDRGKLIRAVVEESRAEP